MRICARLLSFFSWLWVTVACEESPPREFQNRISPYHTVPPSPELALHPHLETHQLANWVFRDTLTGMNSREHFVLGGLFHETESFLKLRSHFTAIETRDGVEVLFKRQNNDLIWSLSPPNGFPRSMGERAGFFEQTKQLRLRVEVHDGLEPLLLRVIVWIDRDPTVRDVQRPLPHLNLDSAWFDSLEEGWVPQADGAGVFWGLESYKVQMLEAFRAPARVEAAWP